MVCYGKLTILDSLHAEEGEVDEVEIKPDPEEGFLPKARLSYRTKCVIYIKIPVQDWRNQTLDGKLRTCN